MISYQSDQGKPYLLIWYFVNNIRSWENCNVWFLVYHMYWKGNSSIVRRYASSNCHFRKSELWARMFKHFSQNNDSFKIRGKITHRTFLMANNLCHSQEILSCCSLLGKQILLQQLSHFPTFQLDVIFNESNEHLRRILLYLEFYSSHLIRKNPLSQISGNVYGMCALSGGSCASVAFCWSKWHTTECK